MTLVLGEAKLLEVQTGCRIHFGLLELADGEPYRFGGLGLMLSDPRLTIRVLGRGTGKVLGQDPYLPEYAKRIAQVLERNAATGVDIALDEARPLHLGLGGGTQLAASVAVALELIRMHDATGDSIPEQWTPVTTALPDLDGERLAYLAGRGLRSAIGLHGFLHGGVIADDGYPSGAKVKGHSSVNWSSTESPSAMGDTNSSRQVATSSTQTDVASSPINSDVIESASGEFWATSLHTPKQSEPAQSRPMMTQSVESPFDLRVILIHPESDESVCGWREAERLRVAGERPNTNREQMIRLARQILAGFANLDTESNFLHVMGLLDEYMLLAAEMFASTQGGLYNGPAVAEAVERARSVGLQGVGQSSWGPTVFGFALDADQAAEKLARLKTFYPDDRLMATSLARGGAIYRGRSG